MGRHYACFRYKNLQIFSQNFLLLVLSDNVRLICLSLCQWVRHLQDGTREYIDGKYLQNPIFHLTSIVGPRNVYMCVIQNGKIVKLVTLTPFTYEYRVMFYLEWVIYKIG